MIYVKIQADTRPDLKAVYTHADVRVWGVPLFICAAPVYWEMPSMCTARASIIGWLDAEWKWSWPGGKSADGAYVYRRQNLGDYEYLSLEAWAERQIEQAPSAVFGWQAPTAVGR